MLWLPACHTLQTCSAALGFASYSILKKVMKRQWGSRRDTISRYSDVDDINCKSCTCFNQSLSLKEKQIERVDTWLCEVMYYEYVLVSAVITGPCNGYQLARDDSEMWFS